MRVVGAAISAAIVIVGGAGAQPAAATGVHDFDFIKGRWSITHHQLVRSGSTEWRSFETDYEGWVFMGGLSNVDRTYGQVQGRYFEGVSVRTFDPATREWTIYWMDTSYPQLTEQVRGHFNGDTGTFYGHDTVTVKGRDIRSRFIWRRIDHDRAHWEQAVEDPDTHRWETNWIMEFHRRVGRASHPRVQ